MIYSFHLAKSRRTMFRATFLFLSALFLSTLSLMAQSGTIAGTILDSGGASIPNAKVQAVDSAKQIVARETVANREGSFTLAPLLPGTYSIKVEAQGFKSYEGSNVTLDQNQVLTL